MRLIDADALIKRGWHLARTGVSNQFLTVMSLADVPTIDIKTEVAREIFEEIDIPLQRFMNERDYSIGCLIADVAELKNKYTKEGVGE